MIGWIALYLSVMLLTYIALTAFCTYHDGYIDDHAAMFLLSALWPGVIPFVVIGIVITKIGRIGEFIGLSLRSRKKKE